MDLPSPASRPDLLVVAGEHSGDAHAARMVRQAKAKNPGLAVCALGGDELKDAGAELLFDLTEHSVVGLFEVLKNYGFFKELFEATIAWIKEHRPRAVCFIDYPGFNLRLAKRLCDEKLAVKGGGEIKLLYYISPQIWAWKTGRRFKMAKLLDSLAVIFPFEVSCYSDTDLPVNFVGHPFVEEDHALPLTYDPDAPILLLPGSRQTPVKRILPVMLEGLRAFRKIDSKRKVIIVYPSDPIRESEAAILSQYPDLQDCVSLETLANGQRVSAVLTSSGTMSLEVALAGVPGAIVYRANPLTYMIGRRVVKIDYLGIANILLDRPAWPEFIQGAASPDALADQLQQCINGKSRIAASTKDAAALKTILGEAADMQPADWLLSELEA
ncbi:lipid-A-disaccharide synthase [Rubellicoccus peritrichatus]|uniref:Lipid-A-disaccharide synthase n=1 Tax=Rubellicoccus peritrichatus TaxID=3080537 RepID=A0AAQ3QV57_9BACT|nr:lipid-A-disaccharide synthase [Puniceicoccus sp. CR14]WOO40575.1 lipid-A-disaccharide synthase [Puniceicoccus sp. CR14]